jgi:2-oxoisovalerate dehydrogenase E2 component (dihydrolipoyl transacylase)
MYRTIISKRALRLPREASILPQYRYLHLASSLPQYDTFKSNPSKVRVRQSIIQRPFSAGKKIVPIQLFDIGEGIAEVELMQWFVSEGDKIVQFDNVCEVQSDKATVEISSRYDGVITKIHHKVGEMVQVGSTLVDVEIDDDGSSPHVEAVVEETPQKEDVSTPTTTSSSSSDSLPKKSLKDVLTTPAVRKIAKENGIDLTLVPSTGPQGRILKSDILSYLAGEVPTPSAPKSSPHPPASSTPSPSSPSPAQAAVSEQPIVPISVPVSIPPAESKTVPISGIQRIMVRSMNESLKIPHFTFSEEVHMDALSDIRGPINDLAAKSGLKLSYLPFIIKALSVALHEYPVLNATITPDESNIIYHGDHNIGVAIDTPRGLLVPSIKQVQHLTLFEIAQELKNLQTLGAAGKLGESHLSGTTITISNMGSIGGTILSPVIMAPQVTIVALGRIREKPMLGPNNTLANTKYLNASWAGDHRIIDGATMARFVNLWKLYLENPSMMLTRLK